MKEDIELGTLTLDGVFLLALCVHRLFSLLRKCSYTM